MIPDLNDPAELEVLEDLIRREKEDGTDPENFKLLSEGMLWHSRLRHASLDYLKQLQKLEVKLKNVKSEKDILDCDICKLAKIAKIPLKGKRKRAERPLEIIHTDIMGPIKPVSFPGRSRFIITFTDDYSKLIKAYSIKTKDEAGNRLEEFIKSMRNLISSNAKVCFIRSDQAPEYLGGKFAKVMEEEKIEHNLSPPYTSEMNGTSERLNRTIGNKIRSYMLDSKLPDTMWELV